MYLRISQDRAGDGTSIDRQRADCLKLAESRGWTVTEEFVDRDVSAYSAKPRPQFEAMVTAIEAGEIDALLAYHPDRLMRRPIDLERLVHACTVAGTRRIATVAGDTNLGDGDGLAMLRMLAPCSRHTGPIRRRDVSDARTTSARLPGLPHNVCAHPAQWLQPGFRFPQQDHPAATQRQKGSAPTNDERVSLQYQVKGAPRRGAPIRRSRRPPPVRSPAST